MDATTVCVVGAGTMGGQIAYQAALHGVSARLWSRRRERLESTTAACTALLRRRVEKGQLDPETCDRALARVATHTSLEDALGGAGVVIESVAEDREVKREMLGRIGACAEPRAVVATNSSTLPSSLFADVVPSPERLLNMHFMNPPLIMELVEVVRGPHTADETVDRSLHFVRSIGRTPVAVQAETFGFIANRILFTALGEAFTLVEQGCVSVADCDLAVRTGLGWPMGPFELADLVGLDVVEAILAEGERQTGDGRWRPPALLRERVERGERGRKNGRGFTLGGAGGS